jgi:hypothetical protein
MRLEIRVSISMEIRIFDFAIRHKDSRETLKFSENTASFGVSNDTYSTLLSPRFEYLIEVITVNRKHHQPNPFERPNYTTFPPQYEKFI